MLPLTTSLTAPAHSSRGAESEVPADRDAAAIIEAIASHLEWRHSLTEFACRSIEPKATPETRVDELEEYLRKYPTDRRHFVVVARRANSTVQSMANLEFEDITLWLPALATEWSLRLEVRGHDLRVDERELAGLGWIKHASLDAGRYVFRKRELPEGPAALAADARAVAASLLGGAVSLSVPMASAAARMNVKRDAAAEDVGFGLGMLFILMPVSAVLTAIFGAATRLVTPPEAIVSLALTELLVVLVLHGDQGSRKHNWVSRIGKWVANVLFGGVIAVVRTLAPVPVVGSLAYVLGCTLPLWLPVAILAVVAAFI
jgi:hypothetical protein